jgi:hypothetical protein
VGLRAVLDAVVKRTTPSPRRESNPRTPGIRVGVTLYFVCTPYTAYIDTTSLNETKPNKSSLYQLTLTYQFFI